MGPFTREEIVLQWPQDTFKVITDVILEISRTVIELSSIESDTDNLASLFKLQLTLKHGQRTVCSYIADV